MRDVNYLLSQSFPRWYGRKVQEVREEIDKRKSKRQRYRWIGWGLIAAVVLHMIYLSTIDLDDDSSLVFSIIAWVIAGIFILAFLVFAQLEKEKIQEIYKDGYMDSLVKLFSKELMFDKHSTSYKYGLAMSGGNMFPSWRFYRHDEIIGEIEGVPIHIQEAIEYKKWYNYFRPKIKGIFFTLLSNKRFGEYGRNSNVVVTTDYTSDSVNIFDKLIIKSANKFLKLGDKIKLEHPEFEEYLNCYAYTSNGDAQVFGRYVMSPRLIQFLVDIKKETGAKVLMEANENLYRDRKEVDDKLDIALLINFKRNLFEFNFRTTRFSEDECLNDFKSMYYILKFARDLQRDEG